MKTFQVLNDGVKLFDLFGHAHIALRQVLEHVFGLKSIIQPLAKILNSRLGLLESLLNKFVTSVIVQGTENPVYGSFSLPLGITSNVLAAYYGTDVYDFEFPSSRPSYYAFGTDRTVLTDEDLKILLRLSSSRQDPVF